MHLFQAIVVTVRVQSSADSPQLLFKESRFFTQSYYRAKSETWEFDRDVNQIWQVLKWIFVEQARGSTDLRSLRSLVLRTAF